MIIQHNITALNANRMLGTNNSNVSKSLEKLSSGYKINKAADDAAGLAISEKMRAQITGLERAQSNAQDGISLVQTAEGALTEVHSMLNRMVDLTTQSANGTLTDADRTKIVDEMSSLKSEIDRVSKTTNFNGINLLDGSLSGGATTKGATIEGSSVINYTAAKSTGTIDVTQKLAATTADTTKADTFTIDGLDVTVNWESKEAGLSAAEIALLKKDYKTTNAPSASEQKEIAATIQKGINNTIAANKMDIAPVKVAVEGVNIAISSGLSGNSKSEVTVKTPGAGGVSAIFFAGATAKASDQKVKFEVANGDTFNMTINGVDTKVVASGAIDNTTSMAAIATQLQANLRTAAAAYNTANSLADGDKGYADANKIKVSVSDKGGFEIENDTGLSIKFSDITTGTAPTTTASKLGLTDAKGAAGTGGLTLQVGETSDSFQKVTVSVDDMSTKGLGIDTVEVTAQGMTDGALDSIKSAINKVSNNRSALGALQNRLEHTINSLGVANENMTAAESRIRDTDMAKEMMKYTKNNVLTQAAQSMLAQANQAPQSVLQLLK